MNQDDALGNAILLRNLGLTTVATKVYPWRYLPTNEAQKGAQIDLVIERTDDVITLLEIKFCNDSFIINKSTANTIQNKIKVFKMQTKTKKAVLLSFITTHGLKSNDYSKALVHQSICISELIAAS